MVLSEGKPATHSWDALLPHILEQPQTLADSFRVAVTALTEAHQQGAITDEELDIMLKEMVATLVTYQLDDAILDVFNSGSSGREWTLLEHSHFHRNPRRHHRDSQPNSSRALFQL